MDTPTGHEQGTYLTLDMGGTNVRVCEVTLKQKGEVETIQKKFPLPSDIKTGAAEELWDFLADCVGKFIKQEGLMDGDKKGKLGEGDTIPLAFTFSYPMSQDSICHGVLQRWTKGFDVKGVEGEDVGSQLDDALKRKVRHYLFLFYFLTNILRRVCPLKWPNLSTTPQQLSSPQPTRNWTPKSDPYSAPAATQHTSKSARTSPNFNPATYPPTAP